MADPQQTHHDNPVEEDSDSELSVLSSRLFNGIEGIEMGVANKV